MEYKNHLFRHSLYCNIKKSAWSKIFRCMSRLRCPKITAEEISNKTFEFSYTGIRSIERTLCKLQMNLSVQ